VLFGRAPQRGSGSGCSLQSFAKRQQKDFRFHPSRGVKFRVTEQCQLKMKFAQSDNMICKEKHHVTIEFALRIEVKILFVFLYKKIETQSLTRRETPKNIN